jgi:hypothetical protein
MRVRNVKSRDTPVEALEDMVSDRGSPPLASTNLMNKYQTIAAWYLFFGDLGFVAV